MTQQLRPVLRIVGLLLMLLAGVLTGAARADVITYFHNDISGSPVAATDESGRLLWKESYRPYGERLLNEASPNANRLWFTGKPQDPDTGLSYLGARYYNPQLGRFMGIDPKAVDPGDPHSFNRYAYANNNPYKFVDPDGEFAVFAFVAAALTTGIITNNALNAYDQNTSVFDEGISGRGVNAAAASVATDTAIAAGAVAIGAGLSILEASALGNATRSAISGFNTNESAIIHEARGILGSAELAQLRAANAAGESVSLQVGSRLIQYEPGLPASGMTMFGENGFLIGREAFSSEAELGKTILHELYRLNTSASAGGVSGSLATNETAAAFNFAERAIGSLFP